MKQQWQQMTEQQKKLVVVLIVVIILAVVLIVWQLMPRRPSTTTTTEVAQQPISPMPSSPMHGAGSPPAGMPGGPPPVVEEMMGQAGSPAPTMGVGPTVTGTTPTPGAPETTAPPTTPPGKLETPPRPGRSDPFADLPSGGRTTPFTPIVLPPTPEPVVIAKSRAGSIGTETFSLMETETSLPTLQAQSVNLRSYFSPLQPITTKRELSGWRLAGTILAEGNVSAIIQTPDGNSRAVRLGGSITYGGSEFTVIQIDEQRVVLKDNRGEEYTLSRRPGTTITPPYGGAFMMPGGFGQFGPAGWGPGGFGQFGPGGWGPGGGGLGY